MKRLLNARYTLAALAGLLLVPAAFPALKTLELPLAKKAPVIDGKLESGEWDGAYTMTEFKTFQPDFGKDPSQKTEAYFLYDAHHLYFAFRCFDTEPSKIKASLSKRDDMFADDFVGVILDTYNTMQSGYGFLVNPLGIQGDGMMGINGDLQGDQDFVWDSKGQIDDQGWIVEYRIPLQSIRFPAGETITFRVGYFRQFVRTSEVASAPAIYPDKGSIIAQTQPIVVSGLKFKRVVELLPAVTYSNRLAADGGELRRDERLTDLSLTGKVGLTTDLTLDATLNPDFSQVEADAGQVDVNLRYQLYYPEKRPFFLEGNEIFAISGNTEEAPLYALLHTRTIADPSFGFKLSGKLGLKNSIAGIFARDNQPEAADAHPSFSIFRIKHALKDDSYVGGFYTGRYSEGGYNQVGGADGRIRLSPTATTEFHLFGSFTKNPDGGSIESGHALGLRYNWGNRKAMVDLGYQDISKDFRVDTGFLTRTGIRRLAAFGMLMFYPESKFFQRIEPFYWSYHIYDTASAMLETFNIFVLRFYLPGSTQVRFEGILANEVYEARRFERNGYGARFQTQLTKHFFLNAFYRRMGSILYDPDDPLQGDGNRASAGVSFQPTDQLAFLVDLTYADFTQRSDKAKLYDFLIVRSHNTFQVNKYFFLRAIAEYNTYYKRWTVDTLASFTYIPGTVVYVGYGSAFERVRWDGEDYIAGDKYLETKRGFFFKVSYLWRW
ncbi:MAG: carbohydrate binding family 9 domain-containing protein [Candidatus Aminicenantes bacterium]|nr:carbohydrate binding family 9 domain-containing protein [Candidatus Aminicenantes bacterium]